MNPLFNQAEPALLPASSVVSQKQAFEFFLLVMLGAYLVIDTLNGLFVRNLGLPNILSAGYKQAFLLFVLIYAFLHAHKRFIISVAILFLVIIWEIIRFFSVDGLDSIYAFQEAIKVSYLFILVTILSRFSLLNNRSLKQILTTATVVIVLNVLSTLVGIGNSTYGDFGAKGFFYAANAVSGVIVICSSFFMVRAWRRSITRFCMCFGFFAVVSLLIGTKGGLLGVMLVAMLVMIFYADTRALLLACTFILSVAGFSYFFLDLIQAHPLYHRIMFFYEMGGIERVLFSGRDEKFAVVWPVLVSGEIMPFLFGADFADLRNSGVTRVEFDWIDMQINFGFLPSLVVYCAYLGMLCYLFILKKNETVNTAIIAFIVLLLISSIAGHVMYNGMVTPLWALIIAAAIKENESNHSHPVNVAAKKDPFVSSLQSSASSAS